MLKHTAKMHCKIALPKCTAKTALQKHTAKTHCKNALEKCTAKMHCKIGSV
jgi:hypothetical protein